MRSGFWMWGLLAVCLTAGCSDKAKPIGAGIPGPGRGGLAAPQATPADKTMKYWNGLNIHLGEMATDLRVGPAQQIEVLRAGASIARAQPTLGIDADLVRWVLAALIEQSRSPALFVEAFARGTSGDLFGTAVELNQAERALVAAFRAHFQDLHRLRAGLSARYGVEFVLR
jgi:hypothetical protein